MKLIEALVVAHQEYGMYNDWIALHPEAFIALWEGQYTSYLLGNLVKPRWEGILAGQSERLETVIAQLEEQEPHIVIYDDRWKIQRVDILHERWLRSIEKE